jgi:hypothetical protein
MRETGHHRAALTVGFAGGIGFVPTEESPRAEEAPRYHHEDRPRSTRLSHLFGAVRQALRSPVKEPSA